MRAIHTDCRHPRDDAAGDTLCVRVAEVEDWVFKRDGELVGGFSVNAILEERLRQRKAAP